MDVNFIGPALLTQRLLPALAAARGRVINLSSLAGENGLPMNTLYSASKFALEGLTEALRHELAANGVQVAMVEPGGFRTRFLDNLDWGERAASPGTVDARWLDAYRGMQARLRAKPGKDPAAAVEAIAALAERRTMPLRTRVGADARALHALKRLLPARVFDGVVAALLRRAFGVERRA
jgi:NAD(P)-dependent dehydrogenase (short-subunit alcohol dehydrogenase family)